MPPKIKNYAEEEDELYDGPDSLDIEEEYVRVTTPSGGTVYLLNEDEAAAYNNNADRYQEDYKFKNISDLRDLDRLLEIEAMSHRFSIWGLRNSTYDGGPVPGNIQKEIRDHSREIREIKASLGIDKRTRDAGQGETLADKWAFVCTKAKEFGYHRNEQIIRAYDILNELRAKITLWENSTEAERKKFDANLEDIVAWAKEQFEEFDEIDKAFRQSQKIWIKDINRDI